ncbi:hypothetical protein [Marinobacter sp.]|uniref:hypothetical protein n=1 Tax=Marinobacter sp. TaxID=50741 RepID=UPI0035640199
MKVDIFPVTEEQKQAADADYAQYRKNNQAFMQKIAAKLEAGEPLNSMERRYTAAAMRRMANLIPEVRPQPNKRPPKVPGDAAVLIASRVVFEGVTKAKAINDLMGQYNLVDDTTVKKAIKRQGYDEIKASMLQARGKK